MVGSFGSFYENGKHHQKGNYKEHDEEFKDIKIGKWLYYNEKGKLEKKEWYNDSGELIKTTEY